MEDQPPIAPASGSGVIPWEEPGRPWLPRLVDTVRLLFSGPRAAYERMPLDGDVLKPFVFALILGTFGALVELMWQGLTRGLIHGLMGHFGHSMRYGMPAALIPFVALFSPGLVALGLVVTAAIHHVFLLLVGGAKRGFGVTLRVVCYAQAAHVLQALPACGTPLTIAAFIVFEVVGYSAAHGISIGRAAIAVALPIILCCVCVAILAVTVGSVLMAHFGSGFPHP